MAAPASAVIAPQFRDLNIDRIYRCETLTQDHVDRATDVFVRSFCSSEPLITAMGIQPHEFLPLARAIVEEAAKAVLSAVVLSGDNIVSLAIVEDLAAAKPPEVEMDGRFTEVIFPFLDSLSRPFTEGKRFLPENLAHLFVTAVDPEHQRKGLSTMVNFHAMEIAKRYKFAAMICEFTHPLNQQGTIRRIEELGYALKQVGSLKFETIPLNSPIATEANAFIWELEKDAVIHYRTDQGEPSTILIKDLP